MAEEPLVWTEARDQEVLIDAKDLRRLSTNLYQAVGVPAGDAELMADLQVETDLRGVHSHGTRALPRYVNQIRTGNTNAKPEIRVEKEGPSYAVVEGDHCMGHLASVRAMQLVIQKASQTGVAIATAINSRHFGPAACYATMALEHGMVGFSVSSSSRGLAPFGGTDRLLGNHPVAWAIPAGEERPLVLDMATGVSAWGRVGTKRMYGQKLTMDWVLDKDGKPTDDPAEGYALLPFGGVKASGFTLVMDVLSGVLPFGISTITRGSEYDGQKMASHFFQAISIEHFTPLDEFKADVDQMIRMVRESRRKEEVDRIYLPGEIEWLKKEAWQNTGIPLHHQHVGSLEKTAKDLGVPIPW